MPTRNQSCPCGSGRRFKQCHGSLLDPRPEWLQQKQREFAVHALQQRRQQGRGQPIISWDDEERGHRFVAVYQTVFWGPWKTFADFLCHYIKKVLGEQWGNGELAKPPEARHPILNWYQGLCRLQASSAGAPGEVFATRLTGESGAYLWLAYDLYTLDHNRDRFSEPAVRERLIARLKHPDQFIGARYEVRVAAMLLRAGFRLKWEDEASGGEPHGEFVATFPQTGRRYWIECKIRQPNSIKPLANMGKFAGLVRSALSKPTDLQRMVFVDLNAPPLRHDWREWAVGQLRRMEGDPTCVELPPAYVLVTNFPDYHVGDEPHPEQGAVLEGFGIPNLRYGQASTLADLLTSRRAHAEVFELLAAAGEHTNVPSTFDGSVPGLDDNPNRLSIGSLLAVEGEDVGTIVDAVVEEANAFATLIVRRPDGGQVLVRSPLSEEEMTLWRRYPETFFGDVRQPQRVCRNILELYDALAEAHLRFSREKLLARMEHWRDLNQHQYLTHAQLVEIYCKALAERAMADRPPVKVPIEITRIRPPTSRRSSQTHCSNAVS